MQHEDEKASITGARNLRKYMSQAIARGRRQTRRYLHKPDRCRLFAEALTTEVKAILADETRLVGTEATIDPRPVSICLDLAKGVRRTIGGIPFQTCGGGKTRLRRESCFVEGYIRIV